MKWLFLANGHKLTEFEQTQNCRSILFEGKWSQIPTSVNLLKLKTVLCYDGYLTPWSIKRKPVIVSVQVMFRDIMRVVNLV